MAEIAGLKLIVPTSVAGSGVSVSASGKVTFTAATAVSVNGCFTSAYDNYLIVLRGKFATAGSINVDGRWRASGTDATGSNYARQYVMATDTSVLGERVTAQTSAVMMNLNENNSGAHFYVYGPFLAQPTATRSVQAHGQPRVYDLATTHSLSTSYDGFTLSVALDNITGALCVYGLSQ